MNVIDDKPLFICNHLGHYVYHSLVISVDHSQKSYGVHVTAFKFAKDIETETKSQNKFLDEIQGSFDNASNLLSNTLHRVLGIPKKRTNNRKFMLYVILFVIIMTLIGYFLIFHRSS
ncbi:unnamed protein product [Trichobilharzia szidati]|nr:unnamed protein product [Trichobilharzia szidati]